MRDGRLLLRDEMPWAAGRAPSSARIFRSGNPYKRQEPDLIYREQPPKGELARFVDCFWFLEDGDPAALRPLEQLLPIGAIEVVIHHRSPFRQWQDGAGPRTLPAGVVAGQLTRALSIQPAGPISTMGVRFLPGGAYPFLGTGLDALTDRITSFAEVWGGEGDRLEERLYLAADDIERVRVAERFFLSRLANRARRDQPIEIAAREIGRRKGRLSVSALALGIGWSPRQMERRFAAALGIGPKALCRIVRFQSLLRAVRREACPTGRISPWTAATPTRRTCPTRSGGSPA